MWLTILLTPLLVPQHNLGYGPRLAPRQLDLVPCSDELTVRGPVVEVGVEGIFATIRVIKL